MKTHLFFVLCLLALGSCNWFKSVTSNSEIAPDIRTNAGHAGDVLSLSASPDGQYLLSGGYDQTARLWEVASRKEVRRFEGNTGAVTAVGFSPDGKKVAIGGENGSLCIWGIDQSIAELCFNEQKSGILALQFAPDGKSIATGGEDKTLRIYDLNQKRQIRSTQAHNDMVEAVQFAPDGKSLLTVGLDRKACMWGTNNLSVRCVQRKWGEIWSASFSADGSKYVTGGNDFVLVLWQKNATEPTIEINQGQAVESVTFSPDGQTLVAGNRAGDIKTWSLSGNPKKELKGHIGTVWAITYLPQTTQLASAGADGSIRLWDTESGKMLAQFGKPQNPIEFVGFASDRVMSWSENQALTSWKKESVLAKELNLPNERQRFIQFSADGKRALTHNERLFVHLWDTETGRKLKTLSGFPYPVQQAVFSPDGQRIAVGISDGRVQLFSGNGDAGLTLTGQEKSAESLSFSQDGNLLFSGDLDGFITTWEVTSGNLQNRVRVHKTAVAAIAPFEDGFVSGGRDSTLSFNGGSSFKLADEALSLSGNGSAVAATDVLGNAYFCSTVDNCKRILGSAFRVAVAPNGKTIAVAARDGLLHIYDTAGQRQFSLFKPKANIALILGQAQTFDAHGHFKDQLYLTEALKTTPLSTNQQPEKGLLGSIF